MHDFLITAEDAPSKREILSKALSLFVKDGLHETSIRAIADATGYTNPALYKFFASKDALALHLFERCYQHVYGQITASSQLAPTFANRLKGVIDAWVSLTESSLEAVLYVNETLREFWPSVSPATRQKSLLGFLDGLVAQGQNEGLVSPSLDRGLAVATIVGTLGQVARQVFFNAFSARSPKSLAPQLNQILYSALT